MAPSMVLLRKALLVIVVIGLVGTGVELLLLEHFDGWEQWIPLALFGAALLVLGWYGVGGGGPSVLVLRGVMGLFVVIGVVGIVLHYRGNVEFELEMEPMLRGMALFKAATMGATPALAPGAMVQIGLIGLAWTWRHPVLRAGGDHPFTMES